MANKKKYCYLTPDFPKKAFMVALFFSTEKVPLMTLPLSGVSTSIDNVSRTVTDFLEGLKKNKYGSKAEIINMAILVPITFQKLVPLKKEFWHKHTNDPKFLDKITAFAPALSYPNLYKLLVLPSGYIENLNHWEFSAAFPFSVFSDDPEIEKFMFASKDVVEIKAKYAALYSFENPKKLNLKTGEVSEIEKQPPQRPKIVN